MSYQLERGEDIGKTLRRICRKQIEAAIAAASGERECASSSVWETRKHIKRARAILQLGQAVADRYAAFEAPEKTLREAGRLISGIRDAEVRLDTMRQLHSAGTPRFAEVEAMLTMELNNFVAALAQWQTETIPLLEKARAAIADAAFERLGCDEVCTSVRHSYKRACKALAEARKKLTPECAHRLRRRVKTLCFQLRIVRPANPIVLKKLSDELGCVASLLGRAHDLNFLGERLCSAQTKERWSREALQLLPSVQMTEADLQTSALELAEHFFAESTGDFAQRIGNALRKWQNCKHRSLAEQLI
ncbi:MAG: CHAD domain-containing protein [Verrucomicrobia bacterium]|nr:CHAD domain-containing protein [Verrucomicrobiota bacterium]